MKIIDRYVLKEHAGPLVFALTALTSLLLLNYVAKQFGNLVGKGLAWTVIGEFFLLSMPFVIAMTLPMSVLVATLYAFSRLAAEAEITAFKASGVSMPRLLAPVLGAATVLAFVMVLFNDQVLPRTNHRLSALQMDIARKKPTFLLKDQVINEVVDGRLYLRAGHIYQETGTMREVVIYDLSNPERRRTIYADSGQMAQSERDMVMTLHDGYMQEVSRAAPAQLQRVFFNTDRIIVRDVGNSLERSGDNTLKTDREMDVCEMQEVRDAAVRDFSRSQRRLQRLATAAKRVGDSTKVEVPARRVVGSGGIGGAYCTAQHWVLAQLDRLRPGPDSTAAPADSSVLAMAGPATPDAEDGEAAPEALAVPAAQDGGKTPGAAVKPITRRIPRSAVQDVPDSMVEAAEDTVVTLAPSAGGLEAQVDGARMELERSRQIMDAYQVEIHKKFTLAMAIVVFVLLGAPIALRFPRGGVGLVIGVSLVVFAFYYICLIAGETMADGGYVPPVIAMWAPNMIFAAVGLALLARMGREAGSARGGDLGDLRETLRQWGAKLARAFGARAERRRRIA